MQAPQPLRIAIIGAGPSGFYAADHLLKESQKRGLEIQIDLIEQLPTPYGLVRGGVAPDHQKIKSVTKVFDRIAADPRLRFFGNVRMGQDLSYDDLLTHYHQIVYAIGAQSDRKMGIPGEDLAGSFPATEFVGWYNAHPAYRNLQFDLSVSAVAIIGNGNVAMDVARILAKTPEELADTDIADYALATLAHSQVADIYVIGRRGPVQASFTTPEIKELGELNCTEVVVAPEELELDAASAADLEQEADKVNRDNLAALQALAARPPEHKPRRLHLLFLRSPVRLIGTDRVEAIELVKNRLVREPDGTLRPRPSDQTETLPVGLVFRSIGYKGAPLPGHQFDEVRGVLPNSGGHLSSDGQPLTGEYTVGWIKRGPSGVIGSNRPDAVETANHMLDDAQQGDLLRPAHPGRAELEALLESRGVIVVTYADWQIIDQLEIQAGAAIGRPRLKFSRVEDMLNALHGARDRSKAGD
ncbi:MAG TPA: FAD-dependent oxidoreductase [Candidatus Limnocylindrales bacterium]|nr:FAD-dependent oxidoreductase [Candidatus Limnocylindrales bacterium]